MVAAVKNKGGSLNHEVVVHQCCCCSQCRLSPWQEVVKNAAPAVAVAVWRPQDENKHPLWRGSRRAAWWCVVDVVVVVADAVAVVVGAVIADARSWLPLNLWETPIIILCWVLARPSGPSVGH